MRQLYNLLGCAIILIVFHGAPLLNKTPPCACQLLTFDPQAKWDVKDVDTPYSDGTAGCIDGRDDGYLSVMMYTCKHGYRLTINMDPSSKVCWGSAYRSIRK